MDLVVGEEHEIIQLQPGLSDSRLARCERANSQRPPGRAVQSASGTDAVPIEACMKFPLHQEQRIPFAVRADSDVGGSPPNLRTGNDSGS